MEWIIRTAKLLTVPYVAICPACLSIVSSRKK